MVVATTVMVLCAAVNLQIGGDPLGIRLIPRGKCKYCCPMEERRDISFFLYTRNNPTRADFLLPDDYSLLARSNFDRDLPTVIYLHGFSEDTRGMSSTTIRDAYLMRGGWNIILVDWGSLCAAPFYVTAVQNSKSVGQYVAKFVEFLERSGVPISSVHVVGFSLGAEAAGFAGQALRGRLPRITGLDPAYPLFKKGGWSAHLSPDDAQFVDVIHTDGGIFGYPTPLGHVDFYPNSGKFFQPGCDVISQSQGERPIARFVACSHQRAWVYYAESVTNECGFLSAKCTSWSSFRRGGCVGRSTEDVAYMGIAASNMTGRGKYYLTTGAESPFRNNPGCPSPVVIFF